MFQQGDLVFDEVVAVTDKVRVKKQPIQVPKIRSPYGLIQALKQNSYRLENILCF